MRSALLVALVAAIAACGAWAGGAAEGAAPAVSPATSSPTPSVSAVLPGIAVVELFTSEGCSSCPPADRVLASVVARAHESGAAVYALAWHVDYWDYLGWKDPYGSKQATDRQRAYATLFSSQLYTPEIIVDGRKVASYAGDEPEVDGLIRGPLRRPAQASLELAVTRAPRSLAVRVRTTGAPPHSVVAVAILENGLVQHPDAGENAGRTLRHTHVVRAFTTLPAPGGRTVIDLPPGLVLSKSTLVAFVQEERGIVGANEVDLSPLAQDGAVRNQVAGRVFGRSGAAVEGALVQACSDTLCLPASSDRRGRYLLKEVPAGSYTVKIHPPRQGSGAEVSLPLEVGRGDDISLPAVTLGS